MRKKPRSMVFERRKMAEQRDKTRRSKRSQTEPRSKGKGNCKKKIHKSEETKSGESSGIWFGELCWEKGCDGVERTFNKRYSREG